MSQAHGWWFAAVALTFVGCSDDQTSDDAADDDSAGDHVPPAIEAVTPSADASAWVHAPIAITFSEAIDAATLDAVRVTVGANALDAVVTLSDDGRTASVRVGEDVALLGALQLEVATTLTDRAGNHLAAPATFTWQLAPWARANVDAGADPASPSVSATRDGAVIATVAGAAGARVVVVVDDAGRALGSPLGAGNASSPSIASADASMAVAWVEGGAIQVARWDGAAWVALPSPGEGTRPAIAAAPSGELGVVWIGAGGVVARRLVGVSWVTAGAPAAVTGPVGDLAAAMPDATTLVAAVVDRASGTDRVRVVRFAATTTELPAIALAAVAPAPHVSVAARGAQVAVAWDEWSGQSSVYAATGGAGEWTMLPMVDVDPPANARAPSIALDAAGAPVVAWTEQIDGIERGFVARWASSAWQAVGGDAWTGANATAPVRTALALWRGLVPIVAWREAGTPAVEVARFNGPAAPRYGLDARAPLAGCHFDAANPPATLSGSGCFTIAGGRATPQPGLVPYDVRTALWTDGALKRRWLALPAGAALVDAANGGLDAPAGTFVVKEFGLGTPTARALVETRFLVRTGAGWQGFNYRWRADGSDADLLPGAAATAVAWALPGGGSQTHVYPSRSDCLRCHNGTVGPLLGVRRNQLARAFDYGGVLDNQPRTLAHLGILATAPTTPLFASHDPRLTLERRIRGYIAANCSHCHNPAGECNGQDFRIATPLAQTDLCNLVVPGQPDQSLLYQMISSRPGMPPVGTLQTDPLLVDLVRRWITQLPSCP